MPIALTCECGKKLKIPDHFAGKRVKCPGCGGIITTPQHKVAVATPVLDDLEILDDVPAKSGHTATVASPSTIEWCCAKGGQTLGPMNTDLLRGLVLSGTLQRDDPVWQAGITTTPAMPAHLVPVLAHLFTREQNPAASMPGPSQAMRTVSRTYRNPTGVSIALLKFCCFAGCIVYLICLVASMGLKDKELGGFMLGVLSIFGGIFTLLSLTYWIAWFIALYRCWVVAQDANEPYMPTPGKAVGFLLIPFFNLYWNFVALPGLGRHLKMLFPQSRKLPEGEASEMWGMTCAVAAIAFPVVIAPISFYLTLNYGITILSEIASVAGLMISYAFIDNSAILVNRYLGIAEPRR